jgi:hypothetical protein
MKGPTSKPIIGAIVVDPTVLNTRERLTVFLESMVYKKHVAFLPPLIFSLIQKEEWNELVSLLRRWEWNVDKARSEEWFKSNDFKNLCRRLSEVCVSFEKVREELSPDERELLSRVRQIIGYESPEIIELAKELIEIAITTRGGIVSYTRHLKRWLKSLRGVLILEISEKADAFSAAKAEIKDIFRNAGWEGRIFVTFLNIAAALALASVLPTIFNWVIDTILTTVGEQAVVGVITNGY